MITCLKEGREPPCRTYSSALEQKTMSSVGRGSPPPPLVTQITNNQPWMTMRVKTEERNIETCGRYFDKAQYQESLHPERPTSLPGLVRAWHIDTGYAVGNERENDNKHNIGMLKLVWGISTKPNIVRPCVVKDKPSAKAGVGSLWVSVDCQHYRISYRFCDLHVT